MYPHPAENLIPGQFARLVSATGIRKHNPMTKHGYIPENVSAVILAGGQGKRMGGQGKAWITLDFKPLIGHVITRLKPQVSEIIISANDDVARYERWTPKVVADDVPQLGPLGGLTSAGHLAEHELILVTPCDTPFLPRDLVSCMLEKMEKSWAQMAVARDPERMHFTILMMHHTLLADAESFLNSGGRAMKAWIAHHNPVEVMFESTAAFMNINTLDDLKQCEEML